MADIRDLFDTIFKELGFPSTQTIIEARAYVDHQFPDFASRQAFLETMVSTMCREFSVDPIALLDSWKESIL